MADKSLLLEVVTPDRQVVSTEVDIVVLPGVQGQFGVLVNHIPFLSALEIGEMYLPQRRPSRLYRPGRRFCRGHRREGHRPGRLGRTG